MNYWLEMDNVAINPTRSTKKGGWETGTIISSMMLRRKFHVFKTTNNQPPFKP